MTKEFYCWHSEDIFLCVEYQPNLVKAAEGHPEMLMMVLRRRPGCKGIVKVVVEEREPACDIINETFKRLCGIL